MTTDHETRADHETARMSPEALDGVREENRRLREALIFARPLVEKWCHYQGDTDALFQQYLGPIDAALKDTDHG